MSAVLYLCEGFCPAASLQMDSVCFPWRSTNKDFIYFYMMIVCFCIFIYWLFYVTFTLNKSHWNIFTNEPLKPEQEYDTPHVLIRNLLHNITNIYLCGGDILGNISDLASPLLCLHDKY